MGNKRREKAELLIQSKLKDEIWVPADANGIAFIFCNYI